MSIMVLGAQVTECQRRVAFRHPQRLRRNLGDLVVTQDWVQSGREQKRVGHVPIKLSPIDLQVANNSRRKYSTAVGENPDRWPLLSERDDLPNLIAETYEREVDGELSATGSAIGEAFRVP
jgi:hypothetical protein